MIDRYKHRKTLKRYRMNKKEQLAELMRQVEANNQAIAAGLHLPYPLLWEEKLRIASSVAYHRELESDEIHFPPGRSEDA
jgi:hypothetical protein